MRAILSASTVDGRSGPLDGVYGLAADASLVGQPLLGHAHLGACYADVILHGRPSGLSAIAPSEYHHEEQRRGYYVPYHEVEECEVVEHESAAATVTAELM